MRHLKALFDKNILPWVICGLAAVFYCYEYLLRITPGVMIPELQQAFSVKGQYLDATLIGHLTAFYYHAYTPMQLPVGLLMDRYGPRWILTIAILCCALGAILFGMTSVYAVAAFGRFLTGFGSAFAFVGVLKLASAWLPPNRFGMISGLATTLGMIGAMMGNIFLTELVGVLGWRDTILYSGYVGLILCPIMLFVISDAPKGAKIATIPHMEVPSGGHLTYSQLWCEIRVSMKNTQIWLSGVIGGLLMLPTVIFPELWGKLYLQAVHEFTPKVASQSVSMIFLGWAVGAPLAGFFSDTVQRRRLPLIVGAGFTFLFLFVFFLFGDNFSALQVKIVLFLIGFFSSVEVICFAVSRENCPSSLAGTVVAVTNFLVVSFSIFQVIIAEILDYTWTGLTVDAVKVYTAQSYQKAMLVLPAAAGIALGLSFLLKETYCKPLEDRVPG